MTTASGFSKSFLCVAVLVSAFAMSSVFPTRSLAQYNEEYERPRGGGNNNNWGEILNQIGKAAQEAARRKAERDARRAEKRRRDAARRKVKRAAARRAEKKRRAAAERERKRKQAAKAERDRKRRQAEADKKAKADAAKTAADTAADDEAGAAIAAQGTEDGTTEETTVDGETITIVKDPPLIGTSRTECHPRDASSKSESSRWAVTVTFRTGPRPLAKAGRKMGAISDP